MGIADRHDPAWVRSLAAGAAALGIATDPVQQAHDHAAVCDGLLALPRKGRVDSLNVSAAATALLFEAVRQREQRL